MVRYGLQSISSVFCEMKIVTVRAKKKMARHKKVFRHSYFQCLFARLASFFVFKTITSNLKQFPNCVSRRAETTFFVNYTRRSCLNFAICVWVIIHNLLEMSNALIRSLEVIFKGKILIYFPLYECETKNQSIRVHRKEEKIE